MVQQTIDAKVIQHGLANFESGLLMHDKQVAIPASTKKTALRDIHNENKNSVPKSVGSSILLTESGPSLESVKFCGTKRPPPDCLVVSSRHQHSPVSNSANGHLVYVRRKSEPETGKSSTNDTRDISADSHPGRLGHQNENIQQHSNMKDTKSCVTEGVPITTTSLECFSSCKPAGPLPVGKFSDTLPSAGSNYIQSGSAMPLWEFPKRKHWEERFLELQNSLKRLDRSNKERYLQMLRSFSSVELSRHAVELEKRSIQLSLEEGREWQRVMLLDVLGKNPKNYAACLTHIDLIHK